MDDIIEKRRYEGDLVVVERWQDVKPYLDDNKRKANDFQRKRNSNMRMVANIPNIIIEKWMKEGINIFDRNHAKAVQAKLNSNEYAYLRTSPGKCKVT